MNLKVSPGFTTAGGFEHEPVSEGGSRSPADMTAFVQSLLQQMVSYLAHSILRDLFHYSR
ncbi:hypothetical protein MKW98_010445, partial [Papaver atlanticum]